ncbi:rho GTPase-activating protein 19 [Bombyx mori]|uniref:Rho-GAP domain-containing protein n=1 Tax=Bombyx mori TaxID=7091 RepID=A0A8R2AHI7_BOMMO|nr:rho GTPase-activating protein 19 [Bombyx mori]
MSPSDITLIERLRNENLEQYFTLVRMHLSFVVDINTDDVDCSTDKPKQFRWNFHKKNKSSTTSSSQNNTNNVKCSTEIKSITEDGIARLNELIDFLSKPENVQQEGIFRRTGSLSRQQELKQLLLTGSNLGLDAGKFSVHDCASVLKGFLAELPQPLLMDQYYQTYCTLAVQYPPNAETSETKLLTALQLLLLLLSPTHRSFLQRLLRLLRLVADNEAANRMSPDTLATMFTPHLLCPRKLSPENFHADAIALSPVISFMIRESRRVFEAPRRLATDAAAYFTLRRRRAMSPDINLDDSITDKTAANTVYTFVDRNRTKAENETNPTDTALAQLYAHIQALPDSHQKRRLIKHFNRQNGYGTPIQIQRTGKVAGSRSFGDSIKRHIFNKGLLNKTPKKCSTANIDTIEEKTAKGKMRFADDKVDVSHKNIVLKNLANKIASSESLDDDYQSDVSNDSTLSEGALSKSKKLSPKFVSEPNLSVLDADETPKTAKKRLFRSKIVTSQNKKYQKRNGPVRGTPTCVSCFDDQDTGSDLSCTDTPKKSRLCDEEIKHYLTSTPGMTETAFDGECSTPYTINFRRASMSPITKSTQKLSKAMQESIMTPRSRKPLIITSEQRDMPDTNENKLTDKSVEIYRTIENDISPKNDSDFVSSDDDNEMSSSSFSCERSRSMQSINGTRPRKKTHHDSRSISLGDISPLRCENTRFVISQEPTRHIDKSLDTTLCSDGAPLPKFKISHEITTDHITKSLTDPFREYLLSRSVLTATPIDLSIINKSNDNDEKLSDSLMYCLDGNVPSDLTLSISNLAVDKDDRLPMMNIDTNIDISPKRKRCDSNTSADAKKGIKKLNVEKENIKAHGLRETEL